MDDISAIATGLGLLACHLGVDPKKKRLRDIPFWHYLTHWCYSAIEPFILKIVDVLLSRRALTETGWGIRVLKRIALASRPLPHGIVVTTETACRVIDFLENQNKGPKGCFAIGPCLCQVSMKKYEGPLMKDIQFLYARDMFLSLRMGHQPASADEVKQVLSECHAIGCIHVLEMCMQSGKWLFCICNCEPRICAPTRIYLQTGDFLWPGPEICRVTPWQCLGLKNCGECRKRCIFDAIPISGTKTGVDLQKCMGCGLCIPTCPAKARRMIPRRDYAYHHLVPLEILAPLKPTQ
jgi:NAD-dependent dihydropyrimidine dehydrogenase PreA subunit